MRSASVPAERALELGLATVVVGQGEVIAAARQVAEEMLALAPLAIGMAKHILNTCVDVDAETGRRLERLGQSVLKTTSDHREGAAAFLEKRPPRWEAR